MLRLVSSSDELEAHPVGRALAGDSFLAWCATPRLVGTVHFGRRELADAHALTRLYRLAAHPALRPPLRRVVDGRTLVGIDDDAWTQMSAAMAPRVDALGDLFERQAVIVAPGVEGVRTASLLPALGPGDRFRAFTDAAEAYRWADARDGAAAAGAVAALLHELRGARDLTARTRSWIAGHLRDARVEGCAAALGVSVRSLQRHLATSGLTFREVVSAQRVADARSRLIDGDAKVDAVARAVGCSSASQLGVLLRRAGLPSPAALRAEAARQRSQ